MYQNQNIINIWKEKSCLTMMIYWVELQRHKVFFLFYFFFCSFSTVPCCIICVIMLWFFFCWFVCCFQHFNVRQPSTHDNIYVTQIDFFFIMIGFYTGLCCVYMCVCCDLLDAIYMVQYGNKIQHKNR